MKLLITTQTLDRDDPFLGFFHEWVREFARHFDEIHVICLQKGEYELPAHVFVYSLGKEERKSRVVYLWRFYRYFAHIFFNVRVTYVFFHMGAIYNILAAPFFMVRKLFGTSFYWWKTHGHINRVGRLALQFVDRVYTASPESFPVRSTKRHVVGHAIDVDRQIPSRTERTGSIRLVTTGRVAPVKGIDVLVRAFIRLRQKGIATTFIAYGSPAISQDTWYEQELYTLLQSAGLEPREIFPGPVPHALLPEKRAHADYFLHSSKTGSMDKNVLDAIMSGLIPFTSSRAYGALFEEFESDLLYPEGDHEALVARIEAMERLPEASREHLRTQLKQRVVKGHSLSTITERIFPDSVGT